MTELIKIGTVFLLINLLSFKKVSLWISLLSGTLLLGFLFHLPPTGMITDLLSSAGDRTTLFLIGSLVAILFFSNLLKDTGRMERILDGLTHLLKDVRVVIALLPAIIGLMPIAGGALVSAPIVMPGCDELNLSSERRTFINYWFRHVWEFILPTFPALILAATLLEIPLRKLCWIQLPLTLVAILSGALVGYWGVAKPERGGEDLADPPSVWDLFKNLFPLVFALVLVVGFQVKLAYAFGVTILGMILFFRIEGRTVLKGFKESMGLELLLTVAIVMGFKKVLESSQAIPTISATLSSTGIPKWSIAVFIPLIIGVLTGLTIAPVAIGFPILIPLLQKDPKFLYYMMVAYGSGIGGVMLSPLHLCLVLTREYFGADWKGVYRLLWIPVAFILTAGLLIMFFS